MRVVYIFGLVTWNGEGYFSLRCVVSFSDYVHGQALIRPPFTQHALCDVQPIGTYHLPSSCVVPEHGWIGSSFCRTTDRLSNVENFPLRSYDDIPRSSLKLKRSLHECYILQRAYPRKKTGQMNIILG